MNLEDQLGKCGFFWRRRGGGKNRSEELEQHVKKLKAENQKLVIKLSQRENEVCILHDQLHVLNCRLKELSDKRSVMMLASIKESSPPSLYASALKQERMDGFYLRVDSINSLRAQSPLLYTKNLVSSKSDVNEKSKCRETTRHTNYAAASQDTHELAHCLEVEKKQPTNNMKQVIRYRSRQSDVGFISTDDYAGLHHRKSRSEFRIRTTSQNSGMKNKNYYSCKKQNVPASLESKLAVALDYNLNILNKTNREVQSMSSASVDNFLDDDDYLIHPKTLDFERIKYSQKMLQHVENSILLLLEIKMHLKKEAQKPTLADKFQV